MPFQCVSTSRDAYVPTELQGSIVARGSAVVSALRYEGSALHCDQSRSGDVGSARMMALGAQRVAGYICHNTRIAKQKRKGGDA